MATCTMFYSSMQDVFLYINENAYNNLKNIRVFILKYIYAVLLKIMKIPTFSMITENF